jgi:hypothetical protein
MYMNIISTSVQDDIYTTSTTDLLDLRLSTSSDGLMALIMLTVEADTTARSNLARVSGR